MALVFLFFVAVLCIFPADRAVTSAEQLKRLSKAPVGIIVDYDSSRLILRDKSCFPASQYFVGAHVDAEGVVTSLGKPRPTTLQANLPRKVFEAIKSLRFVPMLVGKKRMGVNTTFRVTCESRAP